MSRIGKARVLAIVVVLALGVVLVTRALSPGDESTAQSASERGHDDLRDEKSPRDLSAAHAPAERSNPVAPFGADWRIVVTNVWGNALPDARVHLPRAGERVPLGTTDARGELTCAIDASSDARIEVEADGYQTAFVSLDSVRDRLVTVVLHGEGVLRGGVRTSSGGAPPSDARVYCWPAETPPTRDDVLRGEPVPNRLQVDTVDSRGLFEFDGLDPRVPYTLVAGASGRVSGEWQLAVRAGADDIVLELWRVHAAIARFVTPAAVSPRIVREPQVTGLRDEDGRRIGPQSLDLAFASVDGLPLDSPVDLTTVIAVKATRATEAPIPLRLLLNVPAHRDGEWDFELPAYHGVLEERTFTLDVAASCLGSCDLVFVREPDDVQRTTEPWGWLVLASATGDELRAPLWTLLAQETLAGIPCGAYRCFIEIGRLHRIEASSPSVSIAAGSAPAEVVFDLSGLASIEVDLAVPNGADRGPLTAYLHDLRSRARHYFHFPEPPYRLRGIPEGRYELEIQRLPLMAWKAWRTAPFDVAPGELVRVPAIAPRAP